MLYILAAMGLAAAGIGLTAWALQDKLVFPGGRDLWCTPADRGWPYEDVTLEVGGSTTHGWFIPAPDSKAAFLFSHGNAGTIADRIENLGILRDLGFDVLIYDYGGYGHSTGRPSEKRCCDDARAMWRYLTETRGLAPERIVLFGRSLGGGVTTQLATEVTPAAVILESTFLSVPALARELFPLLPVHRLIRTQFDNAAKMPNLRAPVLVVHSPQDSLVPFAHGKRLYDLARPPKAFLEITGDHGDGFWVTGAAYGEGLARFLNPILNAATP